MKKNYLFIGLFLIISIMFSSCKKDSIIADVKKDLENGKYLSNDTFQKLEKGKYDIYETDENGKNLLTGNTLSTEDMYRLISRYKFDICHADANGTIPFLENPDKYFDLFSEHSCGTGSYFYIKLSTLLNTEPLYDFSKINANDYYLESLFSEYITHIDVNAKDSENVSYFIKSLSWGNSMYPGMIFYSPTYKKNYEDFTYLKDNIRELNLDYSSNYSLSKLYDNYAEYYVYKEAREFEPERKIIMPGDEEYVYKISEDELKCLVFEPSDTETYTMVKTQLKTENSIVEIPCGTKVEILENVGDSYIEDDCLVNDVKVKCLNKVGVMSSRYISNSFSELDIDKDGRKELLLVNYSETMENNYSRFTTAVIIYNGKSIQITLPEDAYYEFEYATKRCLHFYNNSTILCDYLREDKDYFNLYELIGTELKKIPLEHIYIAPDEGYNHSILSFIRMEVETSPDGFHTISLIRDAYNEQCYDYEYYHYSISDEWFMDAFDYYYDYSTIVTIYEEQKGYFVVNGEDPNYEDYYSYYYDDWGM